jgi:hypothetical protein
LALWDNFEIKMVYRITKPLLSHICSVNSLGYSATIYLPLSHFPADVPTFSARIVDPES